MQPKQLAGTTLTALLKWLTDFGLNKDIKASKCPSISDVRQGRDFKLKPLGVNLKILHPKRMELESFAF